MNKTLVIDLDGTLCEQGDISTYINAKPKNDVIDSVNRAFYSGWNVIIHTARGMNTFNGDVELVKKNLDSITRHWLEYNNVRYTDLFFGKPPGDLYVDDKGLSISDFVSFEVK